MNGFDNLTSSEKLSALLDGELTAGQTETLFLDLAQNQDLQHELADMISIRNMFRDPSEKPPTGSKEKLFAAAGLAAFTTQPAKAGGSFFAGIGSVLSSKFFVGAVSAIVAAVGAFLLSGALRNDVVEYPTISEDFLNTTPAVEIVTPAEKTTPNRPTETPYVSSFAISAPRSTQAIDNESAPVRRIAAVDDNRASTEVLRPKQSLGAGEYLSAMAPKINPISEDFGLTPRSTYEGFNLDKFSLQTRGFNGVSFPSVDLPPLDYSFNNIALGFYYDLDDRNSVGIEVGRESFLQRYDGYEDGDKVVYEQNYTALWMGLGYKYKGDEIPGILDARPFVAGFLGAAEVGPVMRSTLGFEYIYLDRFSFFGGLEATALTYLYQNSFFVTTKIGATYGVSLKF